MWHRHEVKTCGMIFGLFCGKDEDALTKEEIERLTKLQSQFDLPPGHLLDYDVFGGTSMSFFTDEGHEVFKELVDLQIRYNPVFRNPDAEAIYTCIDEVEDDRWAVVYKDRYQVLIADPKYIASRKVITSDRLPDPGKYGSK